MKLVTLIFLSVIAFLVARPSFAQQSMSVMMPATIYDFSFEKPEGGVFDLSPYKGKVLLVVNTATECGFAGQFSGLQNLYTQHKEKGFVVIGVPSNDFGHQEPLSSVDVVKYTKDTFGVTFPLAAKTIVSGDNAHPFYLWAAQQNKGGLLNARPRWNFHKYLIDRNGLLIDSFSSMTSPNDSDLVKKIEQALNEKSDIAGNK
jgi:glutathione peroxidase